jgi:hypothetical protein
MSIEAVRIMSDNYLQSIVNIGYIESGEFYSFGKRIDEKVLIFTDTNKTKSAYELDFKQQTLNKVDCFVCDTGREYKIRSQIKVNRTIVEWRDSSDQEFYHISIENEQLYSLYFPPIGNLVYIGTRKSRVEGNGSLYCFKEGKLHFKYNPTESQRHPLLYDRTISDIKAYPYRIIGNSVGSRIAFSFLNHLYFLNDQGEITAKYNTSELIRAEPKNYESKEIFLATGLNINNQEDDSYSIKSFIDYGPQPEVPYIDCLKFSPDQKYYLVSIRNQLFWLSPEGKLAHSKTLEIGYSDGIGDAGAIKSFQMSEDGNIIIAEVTCEGIVALFKGSVISFLKCDYRNSPIAINGKNNVIVIASGKTLQIYDLQLELLSSVELNTKIENVYFDKNGETLFVSGRPNIVLLFKYGKDKAKSIRYKDHATENFSKLIDPRRFKKTPSWEIMIPVSYACVRKYHISPDGRSICILIDDVDTNTLETYQDGKKIQSTNNRSLIRQQWNGFISKEEGSLVGAIKVKHKNRKLYYYEKDDKLAWIFESGAKIRHSGVSNSGNNITIVAGVYVYYLNRQGELFNFFKMNALYAFPNDNGDIVVFTKDQEVILCSKDGDIKIKKLLPERIERYYNTYKNEYIAFTTATQDVYSVWVSDFSIDIRLNWEVPIRGLSPVVLGWASLKPVLYIYKLHEFFAAFDMEQYNKIRE